MLSRLCFGLVLLLLSSYVTAGTGLAQYSLKNLRSGEITDLATVTQGTVALMFYEPDCSWCRKQAQALTELQQQCGNVTPIALGINASRLALKKALFTLQFPFAGFMAPHQLLQDLGGIPATPITLVFKQQQLIGAFRGYQPATVLQTKTGC
ncbi:hypothetical protein HR45_17445 [Shewanella mangrovi]|uniref:Thioredoxin domain-containing protein n=1 Tax=Shewanella mangrovi TaxID=1515746 RepID=A0A094JUY3_9GAMM|nr:hypothetical protein [Shewanella mangrovi]KFZ36286.1 hypothetical protein HR45_17445 [Shewanella mangrovi]